MQIAIDDAGSTTIVRLVGRLDISGAEVVAVPLATLSGSKSSLVIDMAEVTFVASIGLRHLVSAAKAVGRRGGRLIVLNPNSAVSEVIVTSGLADLLRIERGDPPQS
jgi:stage II sporulation protein AA (anti-sigma F factor antagonist)